MTAQTARLALIGFSMLFLAPATGAQETGGNPAPDETKATLAAEADHLLGELERLRSDYREMRVRRDATTGDERAVLRIQMREKLLSFKRNVDKLVGNMKRQQKEGIDTPRGRRRTRSLLRDMGRSLPLFIEDLREEAGELREEVEKAPPEGVPELRETAQEHQEVIDEVFRFYVDLLNYLEAMGLPSKATRAQLAAQLPTRAAALSGRLELARDRLDTALSESHANLGDSALEGGVRVAEDHLDAVASSLWITSDLMEKLGLPTAEYRQVLIRTTREITGDLFDVEVAAGLLEQGTTAAMRWVERRGPGLLGRTAIFVAIVMFFWMVGVVARRILARALRSAASMSEIARRVLVNTASRVIVAIGIFVALAQIDVNVTALLTGLGIAGFIAGFALQDTLGNFAAGAMILMYRPFDVGDIIEAAGVYGTVHNTTLVSTTILTFDNETLVVPNSKIWGDVIRNVTAQQVRRVDLEVGLAHDADLAQAETLLHSVIAAHEKVLEDPAPAVRVHKLTESAVLLVVRPWVRREDYWEVYWDLTREVKLRLGQENIALAVPHRQARIERG